MITTHVLDTAAGRPARGVPVELERQAESVFGGSSSWEPVGVGTTDNDGRNRELTPEGPVEPGLYRIRFNTAAYFEATKVKGFFPIVEITFQIEDGTQHYHVPLLLSPFGYSTYRGS
jgi:5-hydroxyisourate hydrolase